MMEFGIVAAQRPSHVSALVKRIDEPDFPVVARSACAALAAVLLELNVRIQELDKEIARLAREMTSPAIDDHPGIGPITATAMEALAPSADSFGKGRDFLTRSVRWRTSCSRVLNRIARACWSSVLTSTKRMPGR